MIRFSFPCPTRLRAVGLAIGLAGAGLIACGASPNDPPPPPPFGPPPPIMRVLDTDRDGTLSPSEIKNASKSLLTLDKNHDGKLTHSEMRPSCPPGPPPKGQGPPDERLEPSK
jgi:EF hand